METITLRTMELAARFAATPPEGAERKPRGARHTCAVDGSPLEPILITTHGAHGVPDVWRAYPLAIDGWRCAAGEHIEYPAFLDPDEVTALLAQGAAAARDGYLDDAELCFRRVVSSWPDFAPGRINLGSVYLDRVRAEQARGGDDVARLVAVAEAQLERALRCEPPPPPQVRLMLGRIYLRTGRSDEARPLLAALAGDPQLVEPIRAEALALLAELPTPTVPGGPTGPGASIPTSG